MRSARPSTTPTWWSPAWSETERPRPARWPRAGTPTSSSTPAMTARCSRSFTSTATRSPTRRCWRASPSTSSCRCSTATDGIRWWSPASSRRLPRGRAPVAGRRARPGVRRDRGDPARAPARRERRSRPRWPMLILRSPKGWTCPSEVDGMPVEGTWRSHQVPVANARGEPRAPGDSGDMAAKLPAE